jgi:hypothetical protein
MNGNNVIMRTIYFKNGTTQQVNQKIVEVLNKKIMEGCKNFQTFSDENNECFLIVNVGEISHVA